MRITQNSMNRTQLAGLNESLGRLQKTQEGLTTGKRLNRPSDSPVDTVSAMRLRDQQRSLSQLGRNIADGLSRLQTADDALVRAQSMMNRVRTQVVAAANGVNGQAQREAYAAEIEQIRQGMVQLANTQYAGQPVFGGTTNTDNAFDPDTGKFLGNDEAVLRKVSEAAGEAGDVNIAVSGAAAFGGGNGDDTDLLGPGGLLEGIVTRLRAGDDVSGDLAKLDVAMDKLSEMHSTIGARSNRLTNLVDQNGRADDAAAVALSKVEDVDFMKAAMDLNIQSNAYNAALQASAKIIQPSLMDFLR